MKHLFLLSLFTLISLAASSQQYGWTDISANLPELVGFTDVHFIGDEGWITGGNSEVFYTYDGGNTFQIQALPENSGITSAIFMKNNQKGYVVTFTGKIVKTENGGANWAMLHEPGGVLNSVHFPPYSDTGYACGGNGTIWSFNYTGITDISPSGVSTNLQSICFPVNTDDGKVCGETTIGRYLNNSWNNLQFYDNSLGYYSIFFINDTVGWAGGINGTIIRTIDGTFWNFQTTNTTAPLNDILFIDSQQGWAVGTETLLHTIDGGATWTQEIASQTAGRELRAIFFTSANNGYVVGNAVVLKYGEVSGIDEKDALQFEIYPNPAVSAVSLQSAAFSQQSAVVEIYDLNGRKLLEKQIPARSEIVEVDVSSLQSGIYCCRLVSEKYSATQKLVIQK